MALSFNPKMLAYDIARGMVYFSPANLKKYSSQDLKNILSYLNLVQRETRARKISQEDVIKIKEKNQQLQRLNQALTTINSYVKQRRIQL